MMNFTSARGVILAITASVILPASTSLLTAADNGQVERLVVCPNDMSAKSVKAKDLKGKPCALLKVVGPEAVTGVDGNNIGVALRRGNETWISLTNGTKDVKLTFGDAEPVYVNFGDYGIDGLQSQTTYLLTFSGAFDSLDATDTNYTEGMKYYYGIGRKPDVKKGRDCLVKAAEGGDADAQYALGMISLLGTTGERDSKLAYEWLSAAARRGQPDAMVELARIYQDRNSEKYDDEMAFAFFSKAAEAGNPEAMVETGYYYTNGLYVAKDAAKALQLFKDAAERGNGIAQHNIGLRYYNGEGLPKDRNKAFEWFLKAAALGDPFAQYNVGMMYENGIGTEIDLDQAKIYYNKAAAQGNDKATSALLLLGEH